MARRVRRGARLYPPCAGNPLSWRDCVDHIVLNKRSLYDSLHDLRVGRRRDEDMESGIDQLSEPVGGRRYEVVLLGEKEHFKSIFEAIRSLRSLSSLIPIEAEAWISSVEANFFARSQDASAYEIIVRNEAFVANNRDMSDSYAESLNITCWDFRGIADAFVSKFYAIKKNDLKNVPRHERGTWEDLKPLRTNDTKSSGEKRKLSFVEQDINEDIVHLAVASDLLQLPGLKALVRSAYKNTRFPSKVVFHIFQLVKDGEDAFISKTLDLGSLTSFVEQVGGPALRVYNFSQREVDVYVNEHYVGDVGSVKRRENDLRSPENYVRFLLADRLSDVKRVCYVDTDIIIQGDIVDFAKRVHFRGGENGNHPVTLAAFPRPSDKIGDKVRRILREHSIDPAPAFPGFNAGILFIDLEKWRSENTTTTMQKLCRLNGRCRLWTMLGSQSPWLVMFTGDRFQHLDKTLMVGELGNNPKDHPKIKRISPSAIFLHWSGSNKPWAEDGRYLEYWHPYSADDV